MNYSPSSRDAIDEHCREVIRSCLNIVEQHGDTYVAIHKDDDIECIVLVSMIRSYPILSIIVADKLLLADINARYGEIGVGLARGTDSNGLACWYCVQVFLVDGCEVTWVDVPAIG